MKENRSPAGDRHPGTIQHVDKIQGKEWRQPAGEVPQSIAWAEVEGAWKAVVRIEVTGDDKRRCITRYDEAGHVLDTTYQIASPPPGPPPAGPTPTPTPTPTPEQ